MTLPAYFKEAIFKRIQESQAPALESGATEEQVAEMVDLLYKWELDVMEFYSPALAALWEDAFITGMYSSHSYISELNPFLQENNDQRD